MARSTRSSLEEIEEITEDHEDQSEETIGKKNSIPIEVITQERESEMKRKRKVLRGRITRTINRISLSVVKRDLTKRRAVKELEELRKDYDKALECHAELYEFDEDSESRLDKHDKWESELSNEIFSIEERVDDFLKEQDSNELNESIEGVDDEKETKNHESETVGVTNMTKSANRSRRKVNEDEVACLDSWIDDLEEYSESKVTASDKEVTLAEALCKLEASGSLAPITLAKFSGSALSYVEFIEGFKIHIHDRGNISDDQRMMQLKGHLTGDAERSISGLGSSGVMYATALKTIKEQFGSKGRIARAFISKLTQGDKMRNNDKETLREFSINVTNCLATLTRLGYSADMNTIETLRNIVRRFPDYLILRWKIKASELRENGTQPTLTHVGTFLRKQVRADFDPDFGDVDRHDRVTSGQSSKPNVHVKGVYSGQQVSRTRTCPLCDGDHRIPECPSFRRCSIAERVERVREHRLCFSCLIKGHLAKDCRNRKACEINGCRRTHHRLLHSDPPSANSVTPALERDSILPVLRVMFRSPNGRTREGNVLVDSGAGTSVIRRGFAKSLGLQGKKERLDLAVVGGERLRQTNSSRFKFTVSSVTGGEEFEVEAYEIEKTVLNIPAIDEPWLHSFPHMRDIEFNHKSGPVDLILGVQYSHLHAEEEVRQGLPFEPIAKKSRLGWYAMGGGNTKRMTPLCSINFTEKVDLETFYKFETLGIQTSTCSCPREVISSEDRKAMNLLEESCKKVGERYEIGLPWKKDPADLPNNYNLAEKRLESLEKKLIKDEEKARLYCDVIQEYERNGWSEVVPETEIDHAEFPVFYLPHHGVYRPDKLSTPLRVVFDPACQYNGISLNSYLHKGPCLIGNLFGVLLRFREDFIGIAGDISKMFLQILLCERDTHVHRFLWRNLDVLKKPIIFRLLRVTFGDKPSPDMASYVMLRIAKENENTHPEEAQILRRDRYMDDLIHSCNTEEEAVGRIKGLNEILQTGSFRIKEWCCSSEVKSKLNETESSQGNVSTSVPVDLDGQEVRTLGIVWEPECDILRFLAKDLSIDVYTKRNVLSKMSMMYDPLGLASVVTIKARIAMQQVWRLNLGWDDALPPEMCKLWNKLFVEITDLSAVQFPRCLKPKDAEQIPELHVFSDASQCTYGAVAYQVCRTEGEPSVRLICSKARVAPLKQTTIPRLELMAALIASRLAKTICEELKQKPSKVTLWTDSQIVLHWVRSESIDYKAFVGVRVSEIQSVWESSHWRFVPTSLNPADDLSRGISIEDMKGRWMNGPSFLRDPEEQWPEQSQPGNAVKNVDSNLLEQKKVKPVCSVVPENPVIDSENFSSWRRLLRVTAYCLKFIQRLKSRVKAVTDVEAESLQCDEMIQAEHFWIKNIQDSMTDWQQKYVELTPFMENGLIRVGGRLRNSTLQYEERHPILLPAGNHVSKLIMRDVHIKMGHAGSERTLCECRRKFWIVRGRNLAKFVVKNCVVCRKLRQPSHTTLMADLPAERLKTYSPPFTVTGVDLFGPFLLKYGRNKTNKAWGAVFTCANIRAIHLEIVDGLSTQAFLHALKRFASHHGWPQQIISDNGTSFVGTQKELRTLVREGRKQIEDFAVFHNVKWTFITPLSPHQGGLYESLVKQTKRALQVSVGQQVLTWNEMSTAFAEVKCLINSRPLTQTVNDPNDPQPLTPNHFLLGRSSAEIPQGPYEETKNLHKRFEFVQTLVQQFWQRFIREYLPTLMKRTKWQYQGRQFVVGDIVLLVDFNAPRGKWNLGKIVEVFPGQDGVVRNVKVRTKNGEYQRSVQKCCLILEAM